MLSRAQLALLLTLAATASLTAGLAHLTHPELWSRPLTSLHSAELPLRAGVDAMSLLGVPAVLLTLAAHFGRRPRAAGELR
ncbi:hypothetical protein ACX31A_15270 [Dermacoccus nishinomiyaensis]